MVELDPRQRAAVDAPAGPVAITAGPGSGKTATMVARIVALCERGEIDPTRSLALTHTTKAAGELRDRLRRTAGADVAVSTIHAAAWRCVRRWWSASGRAGTPELVANNYQLIRRAADQVIGGRVETSTVSDLATEIDWARANLIDPGRYSAEVAKRRRSASVDGPTVTKVWRRYDELRDEADVIDFADVLAIATDMATGEHADEITSRIDALFVDEYQDVDNAQQQLIEAWLAGSGRLSVVGDPDQCIFAWKGADSAHLEQFSTRWPDATEIALIDNWRSHTEIVDWVQALATPGRERLTSTRGDGGTVGVHAASTEAEEERALCTQLHAWHRAGIPWTEMAILHRFNATSARVEAALLDAGIPHTIAGAQRFFDRPEVRAVLVPFGQQARREPDRDGLELLSDVAAVSGYDAVNPPAGVGAARQRWEAITALISLVADSMTGLAASWVLEELQQRAKSGAEVGVDGVTIATVHSAKGLEWDCVWVIGMTEGQMPSSFAKSAADLEEERRVCFVALSRARRHLVCSWAERRHNKWSDRPSRYLELLGAGASRGTTRTPKRAETGAVAADRPRSSECDRCGGRLTSAEARRTRRCSGDCLEGAPRRRWGQLVAWRDAAAVAAGVAGKDVASDRALFVAAVRGDSTGVTGFRGGFPPPPV